VLLLILLTGNNRVNGQEDLNVIKNNWLQYSDAPNSLYNYLSGQAYDLLAKREATVSAINTLAGWQERQKWIKETLLGIVGPFPEKTPLNATIVRTIDKTTYKVEHIIYESQPGFYVTSSLFIPAGLKKTGKAPAVIYCSGHSENGYRSDVYQHVILNLVKKGFIVFAFDPVGQGERLEYYDPATNKSKVGGPTTEHSYPGTQAFITGSSQARYMIWDGIRAVDYLLSRKEVDHARIGITGRSGGGTQSACIAAMDDRILAAAPECYITNFKRLLQSIGNQDAEQNLSGEIALGIDHADLLSVRAPKPALMITTSRDMFSIQGAMETEKEVAVIYKAYGREDNFGRVEDDFPHASTKKNRIALYTFFQKSLGNPGSPDDDTLSTLNEEEMRVTATGQLSTSWKGETVFSLNSKEAEKLKSRLQASRRDSLSHLANVLSSARKLSGYKEPSVVNMPVLTGRFQREGYIVAKYFIKGEGDYIIPYLLMIPETSNNKALIYLHPSGKSAEGAVGGEIEWFVRLGFTVLAPDLIGTGETGPGIFDGDASIDGISHNTWYASILIGRSIAGIRAGDVVSLVRLLEKRSGTKEVYGFARKEMGPVLLHAAAFAPDIAYVALLEPFSSYQSIVMNHFYNSAFIPSVVPGALSAYDIPDLAASIAPRRLMMAGVTDGNGNTADSTGIKEDLDIIRNVYKSKNKESELIIAPLKPGQKISDLLMEWIK
jgi:hypothetical protein